MNTGIRGKQAPPLNAVHWRDANGNPVDTLALADLPGRFTLLFFFQSWCPGCHSTGFPTLAKILERTSRSDLSAVAVQTVFEGYEENPPEKAWALQQEHGLQIPFGHDGSAAQSPLMAAYRTGGTPWFVLIDPEGKVVANTFRFDAEAVSNLVSTPIGLVQALVGRLWPESAAQPKTQPPDDVCGNCWAQADYEGQLQEAVKSHKAYVNNKRAQHAFIQGFVVEHISDITLKNTPKGRLCLRCGRSHPDKTAGQ